MLVSGRTLMLTSMMLAAAATSARAQQKECEIDEGKPSEVAKAMLQLQLVQNAKPEDAAKNLRGAVSQIEKADKSKNPTGQAFVLGKALVLWMGQPAQPAVTTRGALGFTQNPGGPIDIVTAVDSLFRIVETAMPECKSQTTAWRAQKGWVAMINESIQQLNAEHADSAEALAKRSNMLNPNAPYGYMVLGNVAQKRNQTRAAIDNFKLTIEKSGADTAYGDLRRQTLLAAANLASEAAESATGADKTAYLADAKWAYDQLSQESAYPQYAEAGRGGLARLAMASGDTTAVRNTYAAQLANPGNFTYQQLLNAGVNLARSKQVKDATTLFEAAYKKNPNHRDVLYNLAIMYLQSGQANRALPVAHQLMVVDPSNGENYRLYAIAFANEQKAYNEHIKQYNALKKAAKTPRAIKAYGDSAQIFFDSAKVAADSAVRFNAMADAFPVQVTFSDFTAGEDKGTLGGTIMNKSQESQTYQIKVEFLDLSGKVVASQTANVGPVAPGQSGKFNVSAPGTGVAAFRYAPLVDPATIKPKG